MSKKHPLFTKALQIHRVTARAAEDNRTTEPSRIQAPNSQSQQRTSAKKATNHTRLASIYRGPASSGCDTQIILSTCAAAQEIQRERGVPVIRVSARARPCQRRGRPSPSSPWLSSPISSTLTSPTAPRRSSPSTSGERCCLSLSLHPMFLRFRQSPWCPLGSCILAAFPFVFILHGRQAKDNRTGRNFHDHLTDACMDYVSLKKKT